MTEYPHKTLPEDWDAFYSEQASRPLLPALKQFYQVALPDAAQTVAQTEFVAVDIETTGLQSEQDDILSIGLVPFNHQRIFLSQAQYWTVKSRRLTSDSVVVHGLTHTDVAAAPALADVLPEVIATLQGKQIVVHYRYMEREFFREAVADVYQQTWLFPVVDTLELESDKVRSEQSILAKMLHKQLPSIRLPMVRERYHLPAYENHNALTDALATAEVFQAQIAHQQWGAMPIREFWK